MCLHYGVGCFIACMQVQYAPPTMQLHWPAVLYYSDIRTIGGCHSCRSIHFKTVGCPVFRSDVLGTALLVVERLLVALPLQRMLSGVA
jgi:hypothetical protein